MNEASQEYDGEKDGYEWKQQRKGRDGKTKGSKEQWWRQTDGRSEKEK